VLQLKRKRLPIARGLLVTVGVASSVALIGVTRGAAASSASTSPLKVRFQRTPTFTVPHYRTVGKYPQLSGGPQLDLRRVNRELRQLVLHEEQWYARVARLEEVQAPDSIRLGYKGLFATPPNGRWMSASTGLVSVLLRLDEIFPGGHDAGSWLALTMRVPSGLRVVLGDLFARAAAGYRALAGAVRKRLVATNQCLRESVARGNPGGAPAYATGFAPTAANYRHFALISGGLAIGFPAGQVASVVCNAIVTVVPYAVLDRYWSALGRTTIAAVRPAGEPP
jgi:hypothetical protein